MSRLVFRILTIVVVVLSGTECSLYCHAQQTPASSKLDESPLGVSPETPFGKLNTAALYIEYGRDDLANALLDQILATELTDEELIDLKLQFGSAGLLRLMRTPSVSEKAKVLVNRITEATRRMSEDPNVINRFLSDLTGTASQREIAIAELINIGSTAAPRLIQRIDEAPEPEELQVLIYALSRMRNKATAPIVAALATTNETTAISLLDALGWHDNPMAEETLLAFLGNQSASPGVRQMAATGYARVSEAAGSADHLNGFGSKILFEQLAFQDFSQQTLWEKDDQGNVEFWKFDPTLNIVTREFLTPELASIRQGIRRTGYGLKISPDSPEIQTLRLALMADLQGIMTENLDQLQAGSNTPFDAALSCGSDVVAQSLELCLQENRSRGAIVLLKALAQIGSTSQLTRDSAIIKSLSSPSRAVQFAAAQTIVTIDPRSSFPESSRVIQILSQAMNDGGSQLAVVVDPNRDRGSTIGGAISRLGFSQTVTSSGKSGFDIVASHGDASLVAIHVNCINWELSQTISNLKSDARTSGIPIAVYGPSFLEQQLKPMLSRWPSTQFLIFSDKAIDLRSDLDPLLAENVDPKLTPQQRIERISQATAMLTRLAEQRANVYDMSLATDSLIAASNDPELAEMTLSALSYMPQHTVQDFLADMTLSTIGSPEKRRYSALMLIRHIQQFNLVLDTERLVNLKQLWQSTDDPQLKTLLTALTGILKPVSSQVTDRLLQYTP